MKKLLLFITAFISILSINSCTKEPVASFSTDKTSYKMSQTITFINQSKHSKEFAWDFGDFKKSTLENPTHAYATAGTFGVTLTVTGNGGTASVTDSLKILPDLTGIWYETISGGGGMGGFNNITGDMNVIQHDDNTLTGSFAYSIGGGTRTANLNSTSLINGHVVTIDWDSPAYKFKGTLNAAGTSMSGTFSGANGGSGTWTATKL